MCLFLISLVVIKIRVKYMKQLSDLEWVTLATFSDKKLTRDNLKHVYRDKNCLVATDGHRLHLSSGLPDTTPGYISGYDGQFPDYAQVMPKCPKDLFELPGYEIEQLIGFLEGVQAIFKKQKKGIPAITISRNKDSQLIFEASYTTLGLKAAGLNLSYITCILPTIIDSLACFALNAAYLIDALKGLTSQAVFKTDDPLNGLRGVLITQNDSHRKALIMPIRRTE